jgi:hypothetical protein
MYSYLVRGGTMNTTPAGTALPRSVSVSRAHRAG